ncbi:MAG: TPR repeat protein [Verrucomicrobiales bacterium]|jgi:TPR repeat protein
MFSSRLKSGTWINVAMNRTTQFLAITSVFILTQLLVFGQTEGDQAKAFRETKIEAEAGDLDAQYELAKLYASGKGTEKNQEEAVKWFRRLAAQNDARGQSMLGVMLTNGKGVEIDYVEAIKWFGKAAAQNSAHAKYNLGYMYSVGKGVEADQIQATKWYRDAAELNDAGSQFILANRLATGRGAENDLVEAYAWTLVVLPRKGEAAEKQLAAIKSQMAAAEVAKAERSAKEISARLAKLKN